jgi:hypothetical protein
LKHVGILELVDQDVFEARAVVLAQQLVARKQFVATQKQFGEIDHAFAMTLLVVRGEDFRGAARVVVVGLDVTGAFTCFLGRVDEPLYLTRRIAFLVDVHGLHQPLDGRLLILRVENLEYLGQPRFPEVRA